MMRSRVVVVIAAALVFAPGWHGVGARRDPRGSDFAARSLPSPSNDEAVREAAADVKAQLSGRQAKRWRPGIAFEGIAAFGWGALAFGIFGVVSRHSGPVFRSYRLGFQLSRGPPRIQPA